MRVIGLAFLALLFSVSSVFALSVSDPSIFWDYGGSSYEITTVGADKLIYPVSLTFLVSDDGVCDSPAECSVRIDLSSLAPGLGSKVIALNKCRFEDGIYHCKIGNLKLRTSDGNVPLSFQFRKQSQILYSGDDSISLTIDDTVPVLSSLETGFCSEDRCFISGLGGSTTITATFDDTLSSFDQKLIMFKVGNSKWSPADSCSGNSCSATAPGVYCSDGQEVIIGVSSSYGGSLKSSEDARNPVNNAYTISAVCDSKEPEVIDSSLVSTGVLPVVFESSSGLEFKASVRDLPNAKVSLFVDTTGLSDEDNISVDCPESDPGIYDCDIEINSLIPGAHDIDFVLLDEVNNPTVVHEEIDVLDTGTSSDVDFVDTVIDKVSPGVIDRTALDIAVSNGVNYPLIVDYHLVGKFNDVSVLQQSINNLVCVWSDRRSFLDNNDTNHTNIGLFNPEDSILLNPGADIGHKNRMILNFAVPASDLPDTLFAHCSYELYAKRGHTFYNEPVTDYFDLRLHFKNSVLGSPGEAFLRKINENKDKVSGAWSNLMRRVTRVAATMDDVCSIYGVINYGAMVGETVEAIGAVLPSVIGEPIMLVGFGIFMPFHKILKLSGDPAVNAGIDNDLMRHVDELPLPSDKKDELLSEINSFNLQSGSLGFIRSACDYYNCYTSKPTLNLGSLSCDSINSVYYGTENGGSEDPGDIMSGDVCVPDYSQSLLASLGLTGGGVCIKGILYNLAKWNAIDCGYLSCLKDQSLHGASVAVCDEARRYKKCMYVYGEIFELPLINVIGRSMNLISGMVQNAPAVMLQSITNVVCNPEMSVFNELKKHLLDALTSPITQIMNTIKGMLNFLHIIHLTPSTTETPPTNAVSGRVGFACRMMRSIGRLSDFYALQQAAPDISIDFDSINNICRGALCDGDDCDYGASYLSFVSDSDYLRRLAHDYRQRAFAKYGPEGRLSSAYLSIAKKARKAAYDAWCDEVDCKSGSWKKFIKDYESYRQEQMSKNKAPESIMSFYNSKSDTYGLLDTDSITVYNLISSGAFGFNYGGTDNMIKIWSYYGNDFHDLTSLDLSESEKKALKKLFSVSGTEDNLLDAAVLMELCQQNGKNCANAKSLDDLKNMAGATDEQLAIVKEAENNKDKIENIMTDQSVKNAFENYERCRKDPSSCSNDDFNKLRDKFLSACREKSNGNCEFDGNGNLKITCSPPGGGCVALIVPTSTLDSYAAKIKSMKQEAWDQLYGIVADFAAKWLRDNDYLDSLKLSSWGDWGESVAREAAKLNTNNIKSSLCEGSFDFDEQEPELLPFADNKGPALTFAAEKRAVDDGTTIYVGSYYIRSGIQNESRTPEQETFEVKIIVRPGGEIIKNETLSQGNSVDGSFAFNSTKNYNELCIKFSDRFPDYTGKRTYCRKFVTAAYER